MARSLKKAPTRSCWRRTASTPTCTTASSPDERCWKKRCKRFEITNNRKHPPHPVGTGGGCEDGWGPCACPSCGLRSVGLTKTRTNRVATERDRHKAPASTPPLPLSLQNAERLHC